MDLFEKYVQGLAAAITVDCETEKLLRRDFTVVRKCLLDILREDAILNILLNELEICKKNFNNSIVLDLSHLYNLSTKFVWNTAFLKFRKIGEINTHQAKRHYFNSTAKLFDMYSMLSSAELVAYVRAQLKKGLCNGYFLRGQHGEIYELELIENQSINDDVITVKINCNYCTLYVDFKVLLRTQTALEPELPTPKPMNNLKCHWLAMSHKPTRHAKPVFSICTPLLDAEIRKCNILVCAYRLITHLLRKLHVDDYVSNVMLLSVIYNDFFLKHCITMTLGKYLSYLLKHMSYLINANNLMHFFDMRINLLKHFQQNETMHTLRYQFININRRLHNLIHDEELTYESVRDFFFMQVNSEVLRIDDFGIYKIF